jgi:hypothetical protein
MGTNPILDSTDTNAKPAAFVAEFIRSHKAMDKAMHRVWERALADSIKRPYVVRFDFVAPAPRAPQPAPAAVPQAVPPPIPTDGLKTPAQAARRLGVSTRTLSGFITSGELRYVNVAGQAARAEEIRRF